MHRAIYLIVTLVLVAGGWLSTALHSTAAPPAPQPVTLPCATIMSVQMLGNAQL
jgi:hypothetical protein